MAKPATPNTRTVQIALMKGGHAAIADAFRQHNEREQA